MNLIRAVRVLSVFIMFVLPACRTHKNIAYFKDISDSLEPAPVNIPATAFTDPKIQPNDILQVSIVTLDPTVNAMLNTENSAGFSVQPGAANASSTPATVSGFMVDKDGNIELPIIGKISVSGKTTAEAKVIIHDSVAIYYKNPVVNVRYSNFTVTVLGEVARPASYVVPNEKASILDAIGMAGDMTIYGKRENVLLIRDSVGQKQFVRFNLTSTKTINSPYFYLRQGDVVYVQPNTSKAVATDAVQIRNITLLASLVTVLVTLITRF